MNPRSTVGVAALSLLSMNLTACELVKGIFKAGVWVGVLGVLGLVVVVALVAGLVRQMRPPRVALVGALASTLGWWQSTPEP